MGCGVFILLLFGVILILMYIILRQYHEILYYKEHSQRTLMNHVRTRKVNDKDFSELLDNYNKRINR